MKKKVIVCVCILVVLVSGVLISSFIINDKEKEVKMSETNENENQEDKNQEKIVVNNEGYDLLSFLKLEQNNKNLIYSPLSIKYALNMIRDGASGNSKQELDNFLGNSTFINYKNINKRLSVANGIFVRDNFKNDVKNSYVESLNSKYDASLYYDSFSSPDNINKWISEKTFGILEKIVDKIDLETKIILVNALAIDMKWESPFSFSSTHGGDFNGQFSTIMNKIDKGNSTSYYVDDEVTLLNMDLEKYEDVQLSFSAIMPSEELSSYIKDFKIEDYYELLNKSTKATDTDGIKISIPKFSFSYDLDLKEDINSLGVKDIIDENKSNLSLVSEKTLFISDLKHKADIKFSEEGIKAAAVTLGQAQNTSKPLVSVEININKPFMFIIRDKKTNEIWFVGTVYEVNKWEDDKESY